LIRAHKITKKFVGFARTIDYSSTRAPTQIT